jgi:hypothetical protein
MIRRAGKVHVEEEPFNPIENVGCCSFFFSFIGHRSGIEKPEPEETKKK